MQIRVRLENWFVYANPFQAPELGSPSLIGNVYDDPRGREDGQTIVTSPIVKSKGVEVTTKSGTVYVLGQVSEKYLEWMQDNNIDFDPINPVKVRDEREGSS